MFGWLTHNVYDIGAAVVGISSVLANIIPGHTIVGRLVNFIALNFRSAFNPPAPPSNNPYVANPPA